MLLLGCEVQGGLSCSVWLRSRVACRQAIFDTCDVIFERR
jgi:hypothetical protein